MGYRINSALASCAPTPKAKATKIAGLIKLPHVDILREMFELDGSIPNGLRWKDRPRDHFREELGFKFFQAKWPTKPAGCLSGKYYRVDVTFKEGDEWVSASLHNHRIIWAIKNGRDPGDRLVDHANTDKRDNDGGNLRLADHVQSSQNRGKRSDNISGVPGIAYRQDVGKWRVRITVSKKLIQVGHYDTKEEAVAARKLAEQQYFGSFAPAVGVV